MSARDFSDDDDDDGKLAGYEQTNAWLERRSRRLLKRRRLSKAELTELAELHARNKVLLRDVERTWPEAQL